MLWFYVLQGAKYFTPKTPFNAQSWSRGGATIELGCSDPQPWVLPPLGSQNHPGEVIVRTPFGEGAGLRGLPKPTHSKEVTKPATVPQTGKWSPRGK